jgi:hypothetical protein
LIVRCSFGTQGDRVSYLTVDGSRASETLLLIHGAGRFLQWVPEPFRRVLVLWAAKKVLFGPSASWQAIRLSLEEIWDCRCDTILHDTAAARAMDLEALACRLHVPTLILCGDRDRLTAPVLSQRLSALIAASRLEIVPSAGHMLPLEAPDEVNRRIRDFIESLVRAKDPTPARRPESRRSLTGRALQRVATLFAPRGPWAPSRTIVMRANLDAVSGVFYSRAIAALRFGREGDSEPSTMPSRTLRRRPSSMLQCSFSSSSASPP